MDENWRERSAAYLICFEAGAFFKKVTEASTLSSGFFKHATVFSSKVVAEVSTRVLRAFCVRDRAVCLSSSGAGGTDRGRQKASSEGPARTLPRLIRETQRTGHVQIKPGGGTSEVCLARKRYRGKLGIIFFSKKLAVGARNPIFVGLKTLSWPILI